MAVIYPFPTKGTPLGADLVLISDSEDDNNTKNATIASMVASNAIDVVDTVTASGGGITASPNKGNVVITNTGVTSLTAGTNISLSGSTGAIIISTSASVVDGSGTASKIPLWSDSNTLTDSIMKQVAGNDGSLFNDNYFQVTGTGGVWMGNIRLGNVGGVVGGDGALIDRTGSKGNDGQVLTSTGLFAEWEDATGGGIQINSFTDKTTTLTAAANSGISFTSANGGTSVSIASTLSIGGITAKTVPYVTSGGEFDDSNLTYVDASNMSFSGNLAITDGKLSIATSGNGKLTLTGIAEAADYELRLPSKPSTENLVLTVTGSSSPYIASWVAPVTGVTGFGTTDFLPRWKTGPSGELTNSSISENSSANITIGGSILNITPHVFGGLKIKDDGSQVKLSGPGATVSDYELKLPSEPTAGGQILSVPATLGSSPYQLEWTAKSDIGHTTASLIDSNSNIINDTINSFDNKAILVQDVWTGGSYTPRVLNAYTLSTYDTSNPGKTGFAIYKGKITDSTNAVAVSGAYLAQRTVIGCQDIALTIADSSSPEILSPGDYFVFVMFLEGDGSSTSAWGGTGAAVDPNISALSASFGEGVVWPTSGTFLTLNTIISQGALGSARVCPLATFQKE